MAEVISLKNFKAKRESERKEKALSRLLDDVCELDGDEKAAAALDAFKEAERRNAENAERLKRERLKANKGVLRSYRIKN